MMVAELGRGSIWIVAGMAIMMALMLFGRMKARRREQGVDLKRDSGDGRREREAVDDILVKLQEYSRETLARLDTKMRVLNEMMGRADATIAELKRLQGAAAAAPPVVTPAPSRPANPLHERVFRLRDEGKNSLEIGEATGLARGEVELILGLRA